MIKSVKIGDIIYIKSFTPKQNQIYIKAVGVVIDSFDNYDSLGYGVKVKWKSNFNEYIPINVTPEMYKNNVFNNTMYEEYNKSIISKLIEIIMA